MKKKRRSNVKSTSGNIKEWCCILRSSSIATCWKHQHWNETKDPKISTVRLGPTRSAKRNIDYSGVACSNLASDISEKYCAFVSTFDLDRSNFYSTSSCRTLKSDRYVSEDNYVDSRRPFAFSAKIQSSKQDNPTYNNIIQIPEEERKLWYSLMVKELKSLRELGSFNMVVIPRGGGYTPIYMSI